MAKRLVPKQLANNGTFQSFVAIAISKPEPELEFDGYSLTCRLITNLVERRHHRPAQQVWEQHRNKHGFSN